MKSLISAILILFSVTAMADEGMWLLNDFPTQKVAKKYKFKATPAWLDHVRMSSARLTGSTGCSGSFVSANGLVMSNHHCARSCVQQISKASDDKIEKGFYAKDLDDEVKCPEMEVDRLVGITDVTAPITKATKGLKGKKFNDVQKGVMSKMEKECTGGKDNIRCDVVTLFHGGKYNMYKYQRYQDVRLVFVPEQSIAFFGGDPDNFNFPRYDLDVSFVRVYENGKPLQTQDYFKWSENGPQEGEPIFVTGHPGSTQRLLTVSELEYLREYTLIKNMLYWSEERGLLTEFQTLGKEEKRISSETLFGVENALKAYKGRYQTLADKAFMAKKVAAENSLRRRVNANPKLKKEYGDAWDELAKAHEDLKKIYLPLKWIENTEYGSKLYGIAKALVRAADELPKPNEKRYREWTDAKLPSVKMELFSSAPIYDEFETTMMTFALTKMRENLRVDNPFVKKVLGEKSPEELAKELVKNTRLKDVDYRKKLFEGGKKAIEESNDPMIQFARLVDPDARKIRDEYEDDIEPRIKRNDEKVAKATFAVYGSKTYPDATFTLRISYGTMKGYEENGHFVKPLTTMEGAFERNTGREPFALPNSWLKAKSELNLKTPMNFCSTNDIIGGNSGSPVIDKDAKVVGLIFDGNIQSLGGAYGYEERDNRAVAVHSSALIEALDKVYGAKRIVDDLRGTASVKETRN